MPLQALARPGGEKSTRLTHAGDCHGTKCHVGAQHGMQPSDTCQLVVHNAVSFRWKEPPFMAPGAEHQQQLCCSTQASLEPEGMPAPPLSCCAFSPMSHCIHCPCTIAVSLSLPHCRHGSSSPLGRWPPHVAPPNGCREVLATLHVTWKQALQVKTLHIQSTWYAASGDVFPWHCAPLALPLPCTAGSTFLVDSSCVL